MITKYKPFKQTLENNAVYIIIAAAAFFIYEAYLFSKSYYGLFAIYQDITLSAAQNGYATADILWFVAEVSGEVGLIMRLAAATLFLVFSVVLLAKKKLALNSLRWAVLLEAIQYLLLIPFIVMWLSLPIETLTCELLVSYILQIILITPALLVLYRRLKQPQSSQTSTLRVVAVAAITFMFAMWVKHFLFALYALPINFSDPALIVGFFNSTVTFLVSALILCVVLIPFIRGKSATVNLRTVGVALIIASIYFFVYFAVSAVNPSYQSFVLLTELWMVSLVIVGISVATKK